MENKERYVIRKVRYLKDADGQEYVESFHLDYDFPCDAYGVYEYRGELLYWVSDFPTIEKAQAYIIEKEG